MPHVLENQDTLCGGGGTQKYGKDEINNKIKQNSILLDWKCQCECKNMEITRLRPDKV